MPGFCHCFISSILKSLSSQWRNKFSFSKDELLNRIERETLDNMNDYAAFLAATKSCLTNVKWCLSFRPAGRPAVRPSQAFWHVAYGVGSSYFRIKLLSIKAWQPTYFGGSKVKGQGHRGQKVKKLVSTIFKKIIIGFLWNLVQWCFVVRPWTL